MMSWNVARAVIRRPDLWAEGLRTVFAVAPRRWWSRPPFLPRPDAAYTSWRLVTAHGDSATPPSASELISYLEWRRRQHRALRRV